MSVALPCLGVFSVACLTLGAATPSWSQAYPAKPVRLIVGGPPAGGADMVVRPLAQKLSESMGQQVFVDNRPGAGGMIASQITAAAPPDGYTILLGSASGSSISPFLARKRTYDSVQDFSPITLVATAPLMVTVHPSLPVKSVKDLISLASARPAQLLYASNGKGSLSHLTTEMFNRAAGISMVHVPYKGGTPGVLDTVSGNVQLVITAIPTLLAQVKASRLRALAITSSKRSSSAPELPTVAESGVPGFESVQWYGMFAPKNTPASIIERLYLEIRNGIESPTVRAPLAQEGADPAVSGPQALAELLHMDIARWQKVIREVNIVME